MDIAVIRRSNTSGKWGVYGWEKAYSQVIEKCECPYCQGHLRQITIGAWKPVYVTTVSQEGLEAAKRVAASLSSVVVIAERIGAYESIEQYRNRIAK